MNYEIIKTSDELRKAIEILATQPVVGLDTETTELDPYTSRLRLIQLATTDRVYIVDFDHFANGDSRQSDALEPLRRLLAAPRPIKIAHNAKFDAKFIKHNLGVDLGGLFDTLLASQLVGAGDIEERHGLETVAGRYLNELVDKSEEMMLGEEGCLSVPEVYDKVQRHARVRVRALDRSGETREFDAEGLLSIAVQHEMDHLLGKVFVEYLSPLKRSRIKTRMLKKTRDEARV